MRRSDGRIAVHVAADPAAEPDERPVDRRRRVIAEPTDDGLLNGRMHPRQDVVDHVDEVEDDVLDLVRDLLPLEMLLRLPRRANLLVQRGNRGRLLGSGLLRTLEAVDQRSGQSLLLREDREPDRLGGVRGVDRIDRHTLE